MDYFAAGGEFTLIDYGEKHDGFVIKVILRFISLKIIRLNETYL